jgi:hypothetical protein
MVKETKFDHHPVRAVKDLFIGSQQEHVSPIQLDKVAAALTSGSGVGDVKWSLLDIGALAVTAGVTVPKDAIGVVLDVAVNDAASAANATYMGLATPGNLGSAGKISYVYPGDVNDRVGSRLVVVELNDDDKIAYMVEASGGGAFDYVIKLIGWIMGGTNLSKASMPSASLKAIFVVNQ